MSEKVVISKSNFLDQFKYFERDYMEALERIDLTPDQRSEVTRSLNYYLEELKSSLLRLE